jgi:hypothetical protein
MLFHAILILSCIIWLTSVDQLITPPNSNSIVILA